MSNKQRADRTPAYFLHAYPFSESSLTLEIFARDYGRVALIARGARRPRSPLRGTLISFQPLEMSWFGSGQVRTLMKAEWRASWPLLRRRKLLMGYYLNELLMKLLPREDAHPLIFDAYGEALCQLAHDAPPAEALRRFERLLLRELGYGLSLNQAADSGEPVNADKQYVYVLEQGAIVAHGGENLPLISGRTLLDINEDNYSDPRTQIEAKLLLRRIVHHQLGGRQLNSRRIYADLETLCS